MKKPLPEKVVTKAGIEIELDIELDSVRHKKKEKEKWIYHTIHAYHTVEGEKKSIGFLRLAYVDEQKKKENFDNLYYYHLYYRHNAIGRTGIERISDIKESDIEEYIRITGTFEDKLDYLKVKLDLDKKSYYDFMRYHYNKPEPDMIKVDENFQRKGVAIELYRKAVEFCTMNGLNFYQSTTQTADAKAIWNYLRNNFGEVGSYIYAGYQDKEVTRSFIGPYKPELTFNNGFKRELKNKTKLKM